MTKHERLVVTAYTEYLMCDYEDFCKYAEEKLGRPILTHEFGSLELWRELKEKVEQEFLALCED